MAHSVRLGADGSPPCNAPPPSSVLQAMGWLADLHYAARGLRKSPGLVAVAAVSLGLGIALVASVFALVHELLLKPPRVMEPGQLVNVYTQEANTSELTPHSVPDFLDLRRDTAAFSDLAAQSLAIVNIRQDGRPSARIGSLVSANFFELTGVPALLGRTFTEAEAIGGGAPPTVVLTHAYWRRELDGDPDVIGRTMRLGGTPFEIVGVTPPGFHGLVKGLEPSLFVPLEQLEHVEPMGEIHTEGTPGGLSRSEWRGFRFLTLFGRLPADSDLDQARAELSTRMANLASQYPDSNAGYDVALLPTLRVRVDPDLDRAIVPAALVLLLLVAMVLVVACANIGNLLLARARQRRREIAVRLSIGAGRAQLVRLLLFESVLLALVAGCTGLLMAAAALRLLGRLRLDLPIEPVWNIGLSPAIVGFTFAVSLLTGIAFGLIPALQSLRVDLVSAIRDGSDDGTGGNPWIRWLRPGRLLVIAQVGLALVLLVVAGLLQRSVGAARTVDVGFDADRLGVLTLDLEGLGIERERLDSKWEELSTLAASVPGVEQVAVASRLPFDFNIHSNDFFIPRHRDTADQPALLLDTTSTDRAYFETLGVRLVEGELFPAPLPGEPVARTAIVNQTVAERFWPEQGAVGQTFRISAPDAPQWTIVGVVEDYKVRTPGERQRGLVHFDRAATPSTYGTLVYRSAERAQQILPAVRDALIAREPEMLLFDASTIAARRDVILLPIRLGGALASGLGLLAIVLAAVGLAGVVAYRVSRRTREIGLRMALGADISKVRLWVLSQGLGFVAIGGALGVLGAMALGRLLRSVLYVPSTDPISLGLAIAVLVAAAVAATLSPMRRATSVDPIEALRSE
ncbi:MAG: hypothetical protein DWQ36_07360 [Acidobacteria bacterium]|nr:MAG: hypothetical protein DWQ36_07360 [Acidobacteriota bacterium]